jgi:hypothetical protein
MVVMSTSHMYLVMIVFCPVAAGVACEAFAMIRPSMNGSASHSSQKTLESDT